MASQQLGKKPTKSWQESIAGKKRPLAPPAAASDLHAADELVAQRQRLPVYEARSELLKAVAATETLVLTGETGCGKTTQIPQYLLESGYANRGLIGVTQPRRVAAISVARRVAAEVGEEVGQKVGYCVRFDDCTGDNTRLRYMTDGMLLREATNAPNLHRYSVIIVDEAHERSLQTDMMLALLRRAQRARSDRGGNGKAKRPLKLIIMSATLDTTTFCNYFGDAPAVQVLGRTFPVSVYYTPTPEADYLEACIIAVMQVHAEEPPGDVLVFLTGQEDIDSVGTAIKQRAAKLQSAARAEREAAEAAGAGGSNEALQLKALAPAPKGTRKIILATNIAETSLTIDGVVYVIDTGLAKVRHFHAGKRIDSLLACPISKAQARQRAGRAGRVQPGKCFRLFTENTFLDLAERSVPEIQRTSLASALLALKALGIDDVLGFEFVSPPPRDALVAALEQLLALGALDSTGSLSPSGRLMSKLPLDPSYSKALLAASDNACVSPMLSLIAMLSTEGAAFVSPPHSRELADEAKRRFTAPNADSITLVNVFTAFGNRKGSASKAWCEQHYVHRRTIESACQRRAPCVLFNELLYTTKLYMRDLTQIDAEWLPELAPQMYSAASVEAPAGGSDATSAPRGMYTGSKSL